MRTLLLLVLGIVLLQRAPASALTIGENAAPQIMMGDAESTRGSVLVLGEQRLTRDPEPGRLIALSSEAEWVQALYEIALTTSYEDYGKGDPVNARGDLSPASPYGNLNHGA